MTSTFTEPHVSNGAVVPAPLGFRRDMRPTGDAVRVVLLDDQHLLRAGLKALLGHQEHVQLVGDAAGVLEAVHVVTRTSAQVVIVNANLHDDDALQAIRIIAQLEYAPQVIALGDAEEPQQMLECFRAGASGFLPKCVAVQELLDAIESVATGSPYVRPSAARTMARGLRNSGSAGGSAADAASARLEQLSTRERTVFELIARGFSGPEIAARLGITAKTVDTYRHRINEKIGVHHRSDYVQTALDAGVLHP